MINLRIRLGDDYYVTQEPGTDGAGKAFQAIRLDTNEGFIGPYGKSRLAVVYYGQGEIRESLRQLGEVVRETNHVIVVAFWLDRFQAVAALVKPEPRISAQRYD